MEDIEEIGEASKNGHRSKEGGVSGEACMICSNRGEKKIERVYEKGNDTSEEKNIVPTCYNVGVWVQDLVSP